MELAYDTSLPAYTHAVHLPIKLLMLNRKIVFLHVGHAMKVVPKRRNQLAIRHCRLRPAISLFNSVPFNLSMAALWASTNAARPCISTFSLLTLRSNPSTIARHSLSYTLERKQFLLMYKHLQTFRLTVSCKDVITLLYLDPSQLN